MEDIVEDIVKFAYHKKVKNFLWRVFSNTLPTKAFLYKKNITKDDTYPICLQTKETTINVLWNCVVASDMWMEAKLRLSSRWDVL